MPPSFRLGLIGAGRMGRTHLRALAGSGQVAVTAIAEVSAPGRDAVASSGAALYPAVGPMLDGAATSATIWACWSLGAVIRTPSTTAPSSIGPMPG